MLKKGILFWVLALPIIFFTGCKPPEPEPPPPEPSIFASWSADSMTTDGFAVTDVVFTFNEDGTFTEKCKWSGVPKMILGTFTPAILPADTTCTCTVVTFIGTGGPSPGVKFYLKYSNLTATTVDLCGDGAGDGFDDGPVTFSQETPPDPEKFFGTWACDEMIADGTTMDDVFLAMNEGGTFSIVMYTTDFGHQTGTFTPATAPADTDLTFTVGTSSGPDQPSPGSSYKLKYSNLTDNAAKVYLDPMNDGYGSDGPFDYIR
jgi:hypothetical protein